MEITVLIDNLKEDVSLKCEHGLSILIEANNKTILFDTGKTDAFIQNAKTLGKDLSKVDYVVLSHSHYDHSGGLESFLKINKSAVVLMKKDILKERWSISAGFNRKIGFPLRNRVDLFKDRFRFINKIEELAPGVFVFPHITKSENHTFTDSFLYVKENNYLTPDNFNDEVFLAVVNNKKLVVFTGCAHNGVENMINTAINYTHVNNIELVIGGNHLNRGTEAQLLYTISELKKFSIDRIAFNHCSGEQNIPIINDQLSATVEYAYTGNTYLI